MITSQIRSAIRLKYLLWLFLTALFGVGLFLFWPKAPLEEMELLIPVDYGKTPAGLTVTGDPLRRIEVRVRGTSAELQAVSGRLPVYTIDLSGEDIGVKTFPIEKELIKLPHDIVIDQVKPLYITLKIEQEITKQVPVVISFSGKPAKGFEVTDATTKPAAVILRGPADMLASLEKAATKPVDISGLSESFRKEIVLDLPGHTEVIFPSGIMRAEIDINQKIITRKIDAIPVQGKNSPYQFSITPSTISAHVKGPQNDIEKLSAEHAIQVSVDLEGLKPGRYPMRAAIILPPEMTLVDVSPELFMVSIENKKRVQNQ